MILFLVNSCLLGVGLAMDAFSVSVAEGLHRPKMPNREALTISGTFGLFQGLMPMAGWTVLVLAEALFESLNKITPWISLILLCLIGSKMIFDGLRERKEGTEDHLKNCPSLSLKLLLVQAVATSIDALSVGFTLSEYSLIKAFSASMIIAVITFILCLIGIKAGKKMGNKLSWAAPILGGLILIFIGIEIFFGGM